MDGGAALILGLMLFQKPFGAATVFLKEDPGLGGP